MPSELGEPLSDRELDVVQQLALGAANRDIAKELSISPNTVKVHLRNVYTKLGVASRTEALSVAMQQGLIPAPKSEAPEIVPAPPEAIDLPVVPATPDVNQPGSALPAANAFPAPRSVGHHWRLIAIFSGLLALTLLVIFWWNTQDPAIEPVASDFVESPIGDSNWRTSRPLPDPLARMAIATNGLNIYHIGGEQDGAVTDQVWLYDTSTFSWRSVASKPTGIADTTAVVLFGEIYVPGGQLADGQPTATVEVYSPVNDGWRPIASLPKPIAGALALTDGTHLYLFGGWDGTDYLDDAFVYDPSSDSWRPLSPLPAAKAFAAGGFVADRLYVVGGYDGQADLSSCHWYDREEDSWHECPETLEPRAAAGAAVIFNRLYLIGGGWHAPVTYSEFLDTSNDTWQVANDPVLNSNDRWAHLGVANVERRIYAMGGEIDSGSSGENLVFLPFPYESFLPASTNRE
ncbi:MAG: hypothetical protein KDE09_00580 [Anaerolineales bacterium]|nr:hypothetical protein [Anaerolineales bacterium]